MLAFAPDASYGTPDDLKRLVEAAHRHGLMIFLDVVYNHFGPEGNYLYAYAPAFFTDRHHTLWGQAINFDGEDSRPVRDFFVHNTLYWLEEYRFDGLRYDAVNAIRDNSPVHILDEIAAAAHAGPGRERRDTEIAPMAFPPRSSGTMSKARRSRDKRPRFDASLMPCAFSTSSS